MAEASKLERPVQWPLEIEVNTKDGSKGGAGPSEQYRALSLAIATMSRWKSLKRVAFSAEENSSAISNEGGLALQVSEPLSSLEPFIMLGPCLSSPSLDKPLHYQHRQ